VAARYIDEVRGLDVACLYPHSWTRRPSHAWSPNPNPNPTPNRNPNPNPDPDRNPNPNPDPNPKPNPNPDPAIDEATLACVAPSVMLGLGLGFPLP